MAEFEHRLAVADSQRADDVGRERLDTRDVGRRGDCLHLEPQFLQLGAGPAPARHAAAPPGFALERANTQASGTAAGSRTSRTSSSSATTGAPALDGDRAGRVGSRRTNSAARSRPWARIILRSWEGSASPGGGERLGDLADRELLEGPLVDQLGAGPQGQTQRHVGQVDRLAPWAGVDLGEEHVDEVELAVADQQVGRLDVAVGEVGVPQLADDGEALVDDGVVDLGLTDLLGALDERKHDQVLPLGGELGDTVRLGLGSPARCMSESA